MPERHGRWVVDYALRRLRPRGDSQYLFSSPENAARLHRAIEDSLAERTHEFTMDELYALFGKRRFGE
ncbi:hypothetical protein [Longimicrobium sp.]|uniref:hypothetical protein n=1 Tax=Longimicrobium sp. TaxID=2029185 RepID=UPI002D1A3D85|nr:hypothetical protein [Longimicrobium sp.]HSU17444.1 hypothetical protein [Longimicrobium sp.]